MNKRFNHAWYSYLHAISVAARWLAMALLLVVLVCFPTASSAGAQPGATVKIDPPNSTLQVGATTVANVRIENVNNLAGAEVHLTYNSSLVEVQQIEAGGFPSPDFVAQSKFGNGRVDYAIAQMPKDHKPVSGSGILIKITFVGRADGTSALESKSVILADAAGKAIRTTAENGSLTVGTGASNDLFQPIRSFLDWLSNLFGFGR